jgi:hypothetical protein
LCAGICAASASRLRITALAFRKPFDRSAFHILQTVFLTFTRKLNDEERATMAGEQAGEREGRNRCAGKLGDVPVQHLTG